MPASTTTKHPCGPGSKILVHIDGEWRPGTYDSDNRDGLFCVLYERDGRNNSAYVTAYQIRSADDRIERPKREHPEFEVSQEVRWVELAGGTKHCVGVITNVEPRWFHRPERFAIRENGTKREVFKSAQDISPMPKKFAPGDEVVIKSKSKNFVGIYEKFDFERMIHKAVVGSVITYGFDKEISPLSLKSGDRVRVKLPAHAQDWLAEYKGYDNSPLCGKPHMVEIPYYCGHIGHVTNVARGSIVEVLPKVKGDKKYKFTVTNRKYKPVCLIEATSFDEAKLILSHGMPGSQSYKHVVRAYGGETGIPTHAEWCEHILKRIAEKRAKKEAKMTTQEKVNVSIKANFSINDEVEVRLRGEWYRGVYKGFNLSNGKDQVQLDDEPHNVRDVNSEDIRPAPPRSHCFFVVSPQKEPLCYIHASDLFDAKTILKFQTPVPTFDLKITFPEDQVIPVGLPSHKEWCEMKAAEITSKNLTKALQPERRTQPAPTSAPLRFMWGQPVWVDADTENKRPGIVIWDEPSVHDSSWFVSTPGGVTQWVRAGRLSKREGVEAEVVEKIVEKIVEVPRQAWRLPEPGDVVRIHGINKDLVIDTVHWISSTPIRLEGAYLRGIHEVSLVRLRDAPAPTSDPSLGGHAAANPSGKPYETWPMGTFDAREWVKAFRQAVTEKPWIANDDGCMLAWFAGAIMTGHDEGVSHANATNDEMIKFLQDRNSDLSDVADRLAENRSRCRHMTAELKEATRYVRSVPDHVEATLKTIAFRLDCIARGVEPEPSDG